MTLYVFMKSKKGGTMQGNILEKTTTASKPEIVSDIDSDQIRKQVLSVARDFKNSWRNLARTLNVVWSNKLYKQWGYETFDKYTETEIKVRKHTVMKLIRSYQFLQQEEPRYLEGHTAEERENAIPSLEVMNTLQRAKKRLPEEDYKKVKNYLLEEKGDVREAKKDLTSLIMKRRKDVDVEAQRTGKDKIILANFLKNLRTFKRDIELLKLLPGFIIQDIDSLISKIEIQIDNANI